MKSITQPLFIACLLIIGVGLAQAQTDAGADQPLPLGPHPRVMIKTNHGDIILELDREKAPLSVDNFLEYATTGFYDGTIFHRVIDNFMIQGGGYTADFKQKPTLPPIRNEADNGLKNSRGTIAMARTMDPHSATAQFFINVTDNSFLDFRSPATSQGWGYAVFGKVIEGMDVVDRIRNLPTGRGGPFPSDVPKKTVLIETVTLIGAEQGEAATNGEMSTSP